jgi:hypothetical protein
VLRNLTVGVDKYILFPSGVDFGKMLMTPVGELVPHSKSTCPHHPPYSGLSNRRY